METILVDNETTALIAEAQTVIKNGSILKQASSREDAIFLKDYSHVFANFAKMIESRRLELTRPLRENVEEINGKISPVVKQLNDLSRAANQAVHEWQKAEMQRAADERRRQLLESTPDKPLAPVVPEPVKLTKTRKRWIVKIIGNIKDVDPQYVTLILDDDKIDAAIKAGRIQIKGLHIYQEEEAVRG